MTKYISSQLPSFALLLAPLVPYRLEAQALSVPVAAIADTTTRSAAVARLASEAAAVYRDSNQLTQLDNMFRLQLLAGHLAEARASLAQLRTAQASRGDTTPAGRALNSRFDIYLRAKQLESDSAVRFDDGFARAFRERFARMDDRTAALVIRTLALLLHRRRRHPRGRQRRVHATPPSPWPMQSPGSVPF